MSAEGNSHGQLNTSHTVDSEKFRTSDVEVTNLKGSDGSPLSPSSISRIAQPSPRQGDRNYNRMKYYSSLKTNARQQQMGIETSDKKADMQDFLDIPEHMLKMQESAFVPSYGVDDKGKHGSFMTIFSTWNCMAGTALTVIPWAFQQSGIMLGILLTLIAFMFSFYTCLLVMKVAGNDVDYTDTLRKQFGRAGYIAGMTCFIINFSVPIILFFQLLAQDLYPVILYFVEKATGEERTIDHDTDWSQFSYSYTCIIIFVIAFTMTAPKDTSIYNKINSFGVVFIAIIIIFTCAVGIHSLTDTTFTDSKSDYDDYLAKKAADLNPPYLAYVPLFSSPMAPLMGILGGGFYFHNIALSVCRNSRNPENNVRDVFLGYFATFLTYILCGVLGVYGYLGSSFQTKIEDPDDLDGLIAQNDLDMFSVTNNAATFIRFCAFAQLLCVNALIISLERSQILLLVTGSTEAVSQKVNIIMNFCLLVPPFLLAIWYPQVGTLAAIGGSFSTMLVCYFLPILTHIKYKHTAILLPEMAGLIKRSTYVAQQDDEKDSPMASPSSSILLEVTKEDTDLVLDKDYGTAEQRKKEFYFAVVIGVIGCCYAVFVFVLQLKGLFGG